MKTFKELDQILESEEFNQMFDFEAEQKEIKKAGWTYKETRKFAKGLSKQIK